MNNRWLKMRRILFLAFSLVFLFFFCSCSPVYSDRSVQQIQQSYSDGYSAGYEEGRSSGYEAGHSAGYNEGFQSALSQSASSFVPTVNQSEQHSSSSSSSTVYITENGEKYHADGCSYTANSKIPISKDDAISRGYTPCSRCKP